MTAAEPTETVGFTTVHARCAGLASTFPAASTAAAWNVCVPRPTVYDAGVLQVADGAPSSEQRKPVPSGLVRVKVAPRRVTVPVGPPPPSAVSGAIVSTVQSCLAGVGSTLPSASRARTSKLCGPWPRSVYVTPVTQLVKATPSRLHWKRAPGSLVNVKVADVLAVGPDGPSSMVVSAAALSIVHAYVAGVVSTFPA